MGGGLLQLVAYGAQDIYLTGNPQITFFKVIYRRHTNFSMECVKQTITGVDTIDVAGTSNASVIISRNGDLLHQLWLRTNSTSDFIEGSISQRGSIRGDALIEEATIEIGGQRIDRHTKEWNQVWAELTTPVSKSDAYRYLTGGFSGKFNVNESIPNHQGRRIIGTRQESIMIPLNFWFCRDIGLALPLIALQYHDVELKLKLGSGKTTGSASYGGISRAGLSDLQPKIEIWADFIYLDADERRRFSQVSHEYLIEQLQIQEESDAINEYKLNFEHPVKELIWTTEPVPYTQHSGGVAMYNDYEKQFETTVAADFFPTTSQKARLEFNGHDRFSGQTKEYFQIKQPMVHHTSVPGYNIKECEPAKFFPPRPIFNVLTPANIIAGSTNSPSGDGSFKIIQSIGLMGIRVSELCLETDNIIDIMVGDILSISYTTSAGNINIIVQISKISTVQDDGTTFGNRHIYEISEHNEFNTSNKIGIADSVSGPGTIYKIGSTYYPHSRCSTLQCDINVYSFAIHPEDHQPSGTCNFSKIDHAKLIFTSAVSIKNIYAVNYNVLRIMSGMGGLAYSG